MKTNVTTTFELENIAVTVSADIEPTDYGVGGATGTVEVENIRIESVRILDHEIDIAALPAALLAELKEHAVWADFAEAA
jgi:hypothetical protein